MVKGGGRHRTHARWAVIAVVVSTIAGLLFVGAFAANVVLGGDTGDGPAVVPGTPVPSVAPPGVTEVGSIPVRTSADVVVWTGTRVLTFGRTVTPGLERNVGADYDPATGDW